MAISPPSSSSVSEGCRFSLLSLCRRCFVFVYHLLVLLSICVTLYIIVTHSYDVRGSGIGAAICTLAPPLNVHVTMQANVAFLRCIHLLPMSDFLLILLVFFCFFESFDDVEFFFNTNLTKFTPRFVFLTLFDYFPFYFGIFLQFVASDVG